MSATSENREGDFIPMFFRPPKALAVLSAPVSAYVEATNNFDPKGLVAKFADDAVVNDQLREY